MHDLERRIDEWRRNILATRGLGSETVEELESHLRDHVEQLLQSGVNESEAFRHAVARLGGASAIASEFERLDRKTWLPIRVVIGLGAAAGLALTILLLARMGSGRFNLLLATHVFTVTVGYSMTFLIGALGLCFVAQRCVSEFSPSRVRSINRTTFRLGCIALVFALVGVILGAVWAKDEWGRYWGWDAKEVGGLAVILWQSLFLFAHRVAGPGSRSLILGCLIGNIVVSLAWFGSNLVSDVHAYGSPSWSHLLAIVLLNIVFLIVGLAPAGWLKLRRA